MWGYYYEPDKQSGSAARIEIDERLHGEKELEILTHEFLHHACPEWAEETVTERARSIGGFLWRQGYRLSGKPAPVPRLIVPRKGRVK